MKLIRADGYYSSYMNVKDLLGCLENQLNSEVLFVLC